MLNTQKKNKNASIMTTAGIITENISTKLLNGNLVDELMKVVYPVHSVFLSRQYYELTNNKPTTKTNTPLDYGKWVFINDIGVIGVANSFYVDTAPINDTPTTTIPYGDKKISESQLPAHQHEIITDRNTITYNTDTFKANGKIRARFTQGGTYDYTNTGDRLYGPATHRQGTSGNLWNYSSSSGDEKNNKIIDISGYTQPTGSNSNFSPHGYYFFTYRKIEL